MIKRTYERKLRTMHVLYFSILNHICLKLILHKAQDWNRFFRKVIDSEISKYDGRYFLGYFRFSYVVKSNKSIAFSLYFIFLEIIFIWFTMFYQWFIIHFEFWYWNRKYYFIMHEISCIVFSKDVEQNLLYFFIQVYFQCIFNNTNIKFYVEHKIKRKLFAHRIMILNSYYVFQI